MAYNFLQEAGFFGQVILGLNTITGSMFLTLLYILLLLLIIAIALKIPIEWISIIYLPLLIALTAYTSDFLAIFGCALIYLAFIIARNLFDR